MLREMAVPKSVILTSVRGQRNARRTVDSVCDRAVIEMERRHMDLSEIDLLAYPEWGTPLRYHFRMFEQVYVVLHPFLKVSGAAIASTPLHERQAYDDTKHEGQQVPWSKILTLINADRISTLCTALNDLVLPPQSGARFPAITRQLYDLPQRESILLPASDNYKTRWKSCYGVSR